ncbi:MAG TPA: metallophosphoesterase family protein [Bacteroidales bacterium]|nr:metallophosphoesterase family protein [Bacteroidales bacterium]HPF01736.1 metallophosphoesterase family protein [Bacteroidales bacterium]HPJ59744.1 metallophosphoesterase family protein [Bacteroidales bacterium]HPR11784.1 metallophosphoesterase family protein [Bacteroidales bacterium]HRW84067.1 metallophosphoesterase family protein [Bacteroidales bacterium]
MRIGIITDIHENESGLQEVLKKADLLKCDEIACLGDIAGFDTRFYRYSHRKSASSCVKTIKSTCRWIVAGNHDLNAAGRIPSWSNGFEFPPDWFRRNGMERKMVSGAKVWCYEYDAPNDLDESDLEFLNGLPEFLTTDEPGAPCLFSHYIFPDFSGSTTIYAEKRNQMKGHWDFMDSHKTLYSFVGHSHNHFAGFSYRENGSFLKAFHSLHQENFFLGKDPVVIMLPPLSGEKGRAGFSILDTVSMILTIVLLYN